MGILFEVATNKDFELEIRYAVARQMQSLKTVKPKRVRKRDYKEEYRKRVSENESTIYS